MNQAGYTLTEMLAAMFMIGLAVGGLSQGLHVIGRMQDAAGASIGRESDLRTVRDGLNRLFANQGPFRSDQPATFSGTSTAFQFDCGSRTPCAARIAPGQSVTTLLVTGPSGPMISLPLRQMDGVRFTYQGSSRRMSASWPPPPEQRETLQSVSLMARSPRGEQPIATARLWVEQPSECQFDVVGQDCRGVGG